MEMRVGKRLIAKRLGLESTLHARGQRPNVEIGLIPFSLLELLGEDQMMASTDTPHGEACERSLDIVRGKSPRFRLSLESVNDCTRLLLRSTRNLNRDLTPLAARLSQIFSPYKLISECRLM